MSEEATRKGVSEEDQEHEEQRGNPRNEAAEDIASRFEAERAQAEQEAIDNDPGLQALEAARKRERQAELENEGLSSKEQIEDDDDPAAEAEPSDSDETDPDPDPAEEPESEKDPLEGFIVERNGRPMVALKVDGEERFLPVEKARAELQKRESGDLRLLRAADQDRSLQERERALRQAEQELAARSGKSSSPPSGKADVDDEALAKEARRLVDTLFEGDQEEAAQELTKILRSRVSSQTPIDVEAVVREAEERVERKARQREYARQINEGGKQFMAEYPDIAADENLFRIADNMTEDIARDNPEWTPAEVMMEAGKRTRAWWKAKPEGQAEAEQHEADLAQRQTRKKQLRPMPRRATATQEKPAETPEESPAEILRQMRDARAQPT